MPFLSPTVTDNVSDDDAEIALSSFRKHAQLDNVRVYFRRGALLDQLPAFVEFLGRPEVWAPFSTAAAYFLGKIKDRFTDKILEAVESYFFAAKDNPIVDNAKAIPELYSKTNKRVSVHVKTCGDSDRPAAVFVIATEDPLMAAFCLSKFVVAQGEVEQLLKKIVETEGYPISDVILNIEDNVFSASWLSSDGKERKEIISNLP